LKQGCSFRRRYVSFKAIKTFLDQFFLARSHAALVRRSMHIVGEWLDMARTFFRELTAITFEERESKNEIMLLQPRRKRKWCSINLALPFDTTPSQ